MRTFRITIGGIKTPCFAELFIEKWKRRMPDVEVSIPRHLSGEGNQVVFLATTEKRKNTEDIHTAAFYVGNEIQKGLSFSASYISQEKKDAAA